jgi:hypothetical protein
LIQLGEKGLVREILPLPLDLLVFHPELDRLHLTDKYRHMREGCQRDSRI